MFILLLLASVSALPAQAQEDNQLPLPVEVSAAPVFFFNTPASSLEFNFDNFTRRSESDTVQVAYQIQANDIRGTRNVLMIQQSDLLDGVDLFASLESFSDLGGTAVLVKSRAEPVLLSPSAQPVADKQVLSGTGRIVWGDFTIVYKAVAREDLEGGSQAAILTLSFLGD